MLLEYCLPKKTFKLREEGQSPKFPTPWGHLQHSHRTHQQECSSVLGGGRWGGWEWGGEWEGRVGDKGTLGRVIPAPGPLLLSPCLKHKSDHFHLCAPPTRGQRPRPSASPAQANAVPGYGQHLHSSGITTPIPEPGRLTAQSSLTIFPNSAPRSYCPFTCSGGSCNFSDTQDRNSAPLQYEPAGSESRGYSS